MLDEAARRAVEQGDADRLLAIVDGLCSSREWASLWQLEEHCRAAVDRGKQLWGVAEHVLYRIALEGPPPEAARAVNRGPTRHTLGPLTEVAASSHTWKELAPHLEAEPARAVVAHERVVRGEPVGPGEVDPTVLELPTHLAPWEGPVSGRHLPPRQGGIPSPSLP
ncbi:MAG: hypothetical protein KatS3mg011_0257 [Acidimicrobiia bacterium]|nr:MAG: hypothetical protein KatS3mg011_0257 [Acidimicrobiia bacterium]